MSESPIFSLWRQSGISAHLTELKKRAKMIAIAYGINIVFWLILPAEAFDPGALFTGMYKPMIALVLESVSNLGGGNVTIIAGKLTAGIEIYFLAGAIMALVTASPVIGYEIFKFVDPALYPNEKKLLGRFMVAFVGLLLGGAAVGYFLLTPAIIRFMTYFSRIFNIVPFVTASDFYGMVLITVGATAISFTTPAIFVLLVQFGIVKTSMLTKNRLIVYLGLYVLIAVITPEPVVGHFGMFFPIVGMLEVSVLVARRIERKREREKGLAGGTTAGVATAIEVDKCKYCGARLDRTNPFCPNCGRAKA